MMLFAAANVASFSARWEESLLLVDISTVTVLRSADVDVASMDRASEVSAGMVDGCARCTWLAAWNPLA
jgi:hypothetical protein